MMPKAHADELTIRFCHFVHYELALAAFSSSSFL